MRGILFAVAVGACSAIAAASHRFHDETKIPPDQLPQAVKDAIAKRFANMEITEASKETEPGGVVYEATLKQNRRKLDVTFTEAGNLQCIERTITAKQLPATVQKAILAKYPNAKLEVIESISDYADDAVKDLKYEALVSTADGKKVEVKLAAEWKIVETEDKTGKKD